MSFEKEGKHASKEGFGSINDDNFKGLISNTKKDD
jgi:hypothetical protein